MNPNDTSARDGSGGTPESNRTPFQSIVLQSYLESRIDLAALRRLILGGSASYRDEGDREESEDEDDEDDDGTYVPYTSFRSPTPAQPDPQFKPITKPQEAGTKLMFSGEFGRVQHLVDSRAGQRNIARILQRRRGGMRPMPKEDITANLVPNSHGTVVSSYGANVYSGQFSKDASFYYTCSQDFRLHIYDTRAALLKKPVSDGDHHSTRMQVLKTIHGVHGRWTITDSHISPDNERIIYASIAPTIYMTKTVDSEPKLIPIHFADPPRVSSRPWGFADSGDHFGIWSCRFSADGNEIIAGGSGQIFVYDLMANKRTVKILAHEDDVNSCCWADTSSGNVLISASDDTFLKVWDRRSLGSSRKPSGVLIGHTEGITSVSAKGDGRYVISNGKDQALRLWDLRKMRSSADHERVKDRYYGVSDYDYRYGRYPRPRYKAHPDDCSVMTYRGHKVLRTLIRCHFSPGETTGGKYIYSGSSDGKIHIWSLDGRVVQVLDRAQTFPISFDPSEPEPANLPNRSRHSVCVRDVSWHPQEPALMSAAWESEFERSNVARHEWKGLSKLGGKVEDWVEKDKAGAADRTTSSAFRQYLD